MSLAIAVPEIQPGSGYDPRAYCRWALAAVLVLALHFGAFLFLTRPRDAPIQPEAEAVFIDLAPTPAPAAEPDPVPPAPIEPAPQLLAGPLPPPLAEPEPMPAEPEPLPAPVPEPPLVPPAPLAVAPPKVTLPPGPIRPRQPSPAPVQPAAETAAPAPVAPTTDAAPIAASIQSWQARLLAHLHRFKRYPPEAQARRREGTVLVRLRLMPDGSAQAASVQRGSGAEMLDAEALAMIARAQPLPVPDPPGGPVELVVPIRFTLR